jgi:N-acetyl-gamma-glutamyl-phosphate reductase
VLAEAYRDAPFVRVLPVGETPSLQAVRGSNFCDVSAVVDARNGTLVALASLDNLVKGAAGQMVQCLNLMMEWPETLGLLEAPLVP